MFCWTILTGLLALSPGQVAERSPWPMGLLTIRDDANTTPTWQMMCPAIPIANDTLIVKADCLDSLNVGGSVPKFKMTYTATAFGITQSIEAMSFDIPASYRPIFCFVDEFEDICRRAERFCDQRSGSARAACLGHKSFFARTFLQEPGVSLALVYLTAPLAPPFAPLAAPSERWVDEHSKLYAVNHSAGDICYDTSRHTPNEFWLPLSRDDAGAEFLYVKGQADRPALMGLPNRYKNLPDDDHTSMSFVYTRIDAAWPWIRDTMHAAYLNGHRLGDAAPELLTPSVPPALPSPKQPNEPLPQQPNVPLPQEPNEPLPQQPNVALPQEPNESLPHEPDESLPHEPNEPLPQQPNAPERGRPSRPAPTPIQGPKTPPKGQIEHYTTRGGCGGTQPSDWAVMLLPVWWVRRSRRRDKPAAGR